MASGTRFVMNGDEFLLDVENFAKKTGKSMRRIHQDVTHELFMNVVQRSPVRTGRFMTNWRVNATIPDLTEEPTGRFIPWIDWLRLGTFVGEQRQRAAGIYTKPYPARSHTYWISNVTPYGIKLEHGRSAQAPVGVIGPSIVEIIGKFDIIAFRNR